MSANKSGNKGKQWWPMRATFDDAKKSVTEFQERLREKKWLRDHEKPSLFYVYVLEQASVDMLPSINSYMQFSSSDSSSMNAARAEVARASSMLVKMFLAVKQNGLMADPPSVFCVPKLKSSGYKYGVIANFLAEQADGTPSKPLSIIVSEHDLSDQNESSYNSKSFVKKFAMPQSGESMRWLTVKTWADAKAKPSFSKWLFGSFKDRQDFVNENADNLDKVGCFFWHAPFSDTPSKSLGAVYLSEKSIWVLPDFWDESAVKLWLKHVSTSTSSNYSKAAAFAKSTRLPGAEQYQAPTPPESEV